MPLSLLICLSSSFRLFCQSTSPAHSAVPAVRDHLPFARLTVLFDCPTARTTSFAISLMLIGALILLPHRNHTSSPGVTYQSSVPCRPHTPWFDGWMRDALASIVQARPCPVFGRPVRHWDRSLDYGPVLLRKPFGFRLTADTLSSGCPEGQNVNLGISLWLYPLFPNSCPFKVLLIHIPRPTRNYPRFWIWSSSSEDQRDFNPPDWYAAQRTLWHRPTSRQYVPWAFGC
jgi:hypothetical protein